jgi:hypothetical protein
MVPGGDERSDEPGMLEARAGAGRRNACGLHPARVVGPPKPAGTVPRIHRCELQQRQRPLSNRLAPRQPHPYHHREEGGRASVQPRLWSAESTGQVASSSATSAYT